MNITLQKVRIRFNAILLALKGRYRNLALATALQLGCELPHLLLVGTHHKTGTAWLMSIFKSIADDHGLDFFYGLQEDLPAGTEIFIQNHSLFDLTHLKQPYRGVHLIRDPRDVIISGCLYHQQADEPWLQYPQHEFGGLSYQQKINTLDDLETRIIFEMENTGKQTIEEMLAWDYHQPNFIEVKYENLICDYDLVLFHEIFTFLGFPGPTIPSLLTVAFQNSLFSGGLEKSLHIRSGKKQQWKEYFTPALKTHFLALFDDALIQLGYTQDNNW